MSALVEVLQENHTWQTNTAALFVAFKEIRQLIFGIERECQSERDRKNADICEISSKNVLNDTGNRTSLIAFFSNSDDRSALFSHEKCFCRHGKVDELENTSIQHFMRTCSKNIELCETCHKGFKGAILNDSVYPQSIDGMFQPKNGPLLSISTMYA